MAKKRLTKKERLIQRIRTIIKHDGEFKNDKVNYSEETDFEDFDIETLENILTFAEDWSVECYKTMSRAGGYYGTDKPD